MTSAVLTVEADDGFNSPEIPRRGALFKRDYGFISSRIERLYVVILQFGLQSSIVVQHGFVCVAALQIPMDHPCDLLST